MRPAIIGGASERRGARESLWGGGSAAWLEAEEAIVAAAADSSALSRAISACSTTIRYGVLQRSLREWGSGIGILNQSSWGLDPGSRVDGGNWALIFDG